MIKLLSNLFLKKDADAASKRRGYGMLCGIVGILLNIILFAGKYLAGVISHSIAITADAFNNLSDAASSVITLLGFKLAGAKPDPDHPFGHGRIEYISGLIVAASILIMAFQLVKDSIDKILHPAEVDFSPLIVGILIVSILVKLYMAYYNNKIGKEIDSGAMKATGMDSLSDMVATTVVLIATLVGHFAGLQIDGYCGVLVGLFIFWAGINAGKETLDPLLGQPADPEFVRSIYQIVLDHKIVNAIHDLIVHDYGPGRQIISLHAEVPAEEDILLIHDEIDVIEKELREKLGCMATIHMDPVATNDPIIGELKTEVQEIIIGIDDRLTLHDFRVCTGPTHTNMMFDVVVPHQFNLSDDSLRTEIQDKINEAIGQNYYSVVDIDQSYI